MTKISKTFAASLGAVALIGATTAPAMASPSGSAAAIACQGGMQGCVLPVGQAAPPATTAPPATSTPAPVAEPVVESTGANWLLPALLGLAAVVGAILILDDDDDDEPVSV